MKLRNHLEHKKPQLMIIPLIDIIFFLLVFFMLSMISMVHQQGIAVNLPQTAAKEQQRDKNIIITITKDGGLFFDKEPMTIELLGERLAIEQKNDSQFAVIINADENAKHGQIVKALDIIKNAGITRLAIATNTILH